MITILLKLLEFNVSLPTLMMSCRSVLIPQWFKIHGETMWYTVNRILVEYSPQRMTVLDVTVKPHHLTGSRLYMQQWIIQPQVCPTSVKSYVFFFFLALLKVNGASLLCSAFNVPHLPPGPPFSTPFHLSHLHFRPIARIKMARHRAIYGFGMEAW